MRTLMLAALIAAGLPIAAGAEVNQPRALLAKTPEAFRSTATVLDDDLEMHAIISTEKAHRTGWQPFRQQGGDNYLRAIVDKRTGATRYEVKQFIRYWGTQRDYTAAHYDTPAGPQRVALTETRHGNDVCPTTENNLECPLSKHLAFEVDEQTLRQAAAAYRPGGTASWEFKFKDATGHDVHTGIVPAEVAGLLQAVDEYRGRSNVAQTRSTAPLFSSGS
jgi:hypothetical protein